MYKLYLSNTDRFEGRGSPSEQAILQGYGLRSTVQKGRRTRKLLWERGIGEGSYLSRWCHSAALWGISGSESFKGQLCLVLLFCLFWFCFFSRPMVFICGYQLLSSVSWGMYAAGYKWL